MTKMAGKSQLLSRFLRERAGNFAMVTAVVIPVILAAGGIAIDLTKTVLAKAELQDASDAAVPAAAAAMANDGKTAEQAKRIAAELFAMQMSGTSAIVKEGDKTIVDAAPVINITETSTGGTGKTFKVQIDASYTVKYTAFTRLLGHTAGTLATSSVAESATESKNAVSMFLVLDKSGSMAWITNEQDKLVTSCLNFTEANWNNQKNVKPTSPCYVSKINALKLAVASLFTQFTLADPTHTLVRTGAISYDLDSYTPSELAWGSTAALTYVNKLVANGGTASGASMQTAYERLKAPSESAAHKAVNGQTPTKYIVFMTDGANNYSSDDTNTLATCTSAKKDGIEIYTVAFMAPTAGQNLLKTCATDSSHYFEAANMAALVSAFKVIGERTSAVVSRLTK